MSKRRRKMVKRAKAPRKKPKLPRAIPLPKPERLPPSDVDLLSFIDPEVPCPLCGGPSVVLGDLGSRRHYRCRNCGGQFSHALPPPESQR